MKAKVQSTTIECDVYVYVRSLPPIGGPIRNPMPHMKNTVPTAERTLPIPRMAMDVAGINTKIPTPNMPNVMDMPSCPPYLKITVIEISSNTSIFVGQFINRFVFNDNLISIFLDQTCKILMALWQCL